MPTVAIWAQQYRCKASSARLRQAVICNFLHPGTLTLRVPGCQKLQMTAYRCLHRMLYSCTHMATVGVKGF